MESAGCSSSKSLFSETTSFESNENTNSDKFARLKRLKIQENLLIKSINKSLKQVSDNEYSINCLNTVKPGLDLKNDYFEIRNLFQQVKETSNSQQILKETDINDIKKDVLLLEDKIIKIKESLDIKIMNLKVSEKIITDKIDVTPILDFKRHSKVRIKPHSDVASSPVKALIHSPLKCAETQDFLDYITTYGRCGNWVEYNHNIFVHTWKKYFQTCEEYFDSAESDDFQAFLKEVMVKIIGVTTEEILEHCNWYSKFIQLKNLRQEAIDRWKGNKLLMKASQAKNSKLDENDQRKLVLPKQNHKLCREVKINANSKSKDPKMTEEELVERLSRPTGQWYNRVYGAFDVSEPFGKVHDPDMIKRLRMPEWRSCLQDRD